MKKLSVRILATLVAVLTTVAVTGACAPAATTGSPTTTTTAATADAATTTAGVTTTAVVTSADGAGLTTIGSTAAATAVGAAAVPELIEFDVFIDYAVHDWVGWGNDPVSARIQELTGVKLNIQTATTNDHAQLNGLIASGALPDMIVYGSTSPLRSTLWKQGFVQPLNKLIDEYAPGIWDILPTDMDKIYSETDGNFYMFIGDYADVDRIASVPGAKLTNSGFTLNREMLAAVGDPEMKTLEQYKEVMLLVKEQFPDVTYLAYDQQPANPMAPQNMAQLINRAYGGGNPKSPGGDGTIHLNFRDEAYHKALLYISDLYRNGLFSPENFTITLGTQHEEIVRNRKVFSEWGQPFETHKWNDNPDGPYQPFQIPTEEGVKMTLNSNAAGIGGGGVSITTNCKDSERAIKFFEWYLSDAGQMLLYHGIEGLHYTMVDGMPKNSPEKAQIWTDNFTTMQSEWGILNYNLCFATSKWVDQLYYHHLQGDKPNYARDGEINNPTAVNERLFDMTRVDSDSEFMVTETKIVDLWKTALPTFYLAESEEQLNTAYNEFIAQAEGLGLKDLEAEYTRIYNDWNAKLNG